MLGEYFPYTQVADFVDTAPLVERESYSTEAAMRGGVYLLGSLDRSRRQRDGRGADSDHVSTNRKMDSCKSGRSCIALAWRREPGANMLSSDRPTGIDMLLLLGSTRPHPKNFGHLASAVNAGYMLPP